MKVMDKRFDGRSGLTLVEILVTIAILAIVLGVGLLALNPAGQLSSARNTQRQLNLQAIMNSIRQNIADASGQAFTCSSGAIPTSTTKMASVGGNYNIAPCLVPTYLPTLPFDPSALGAHYNNPSDYDTGYSIAQASTGIITVNAPYAELGQTISLSR